MPPRKRKANLANKIAAKTWRLLCKEHPPEDESIILRANGKTYFAIRAIDESGDFIHCQDQENGGFMFSINLLVPFDDKSFEWRYFDD